MNLQFKYLYEIFYILSFMTDGKKDIFLNIVIDLHIVWKLGGQSYEYEDNGIFKL